MAADANRATLVLIHRSFADAAVKSSAYGHILPFFETMFTLQEAAVKTVGPKPILQDGQALNAEHEGRWPLLDRRHLPVDQTAATDMLASLCDNAEKPTEALQQAALVMRKRLLDSGDDIARGYRLLLKDDQDGMKKLALDIGMDAFMLNFFLYNSLLPTIVGHARLLAQHLDAGQSLETGHCPICGGMPNFSYFSDNGERLLVCHFCRHQWQVKRNFCPVCNAIKTRGIDYFFSETEKAYRVYTCADCRTYLKTVDTRKLDRPFYPPLEILVTAHLDLQAKENGFQGIVPGPWSG